MASILRRLLITAAVGFVFSATVQAQAVRPRERSFEASETLAADLRRARLHNGPFYLLSNLQLSDLGYEQQFFLPTSQQSGGLSFAVSAPQKLYFVPARKTIYAVTVTPEYAVFSRQGGSNELGYLARGEAHYLLNHFYFNPYATHADHLRALIGEINRVATERENTVGLNGEYRYSSKTRLLYSASGQRFAYPFTRYQPSDVPELRILEHSEHNYRATFRHQTLPLTALTLTGEWNDFAFRNAPEKNGRRRFFGPGFAYDAGRTTLRAQAGATRLHFNTPGQKEFSGITGNTQFTKRLGVKSSLTIAGERDLDFSVFQGNNYYIADRASLLLEQQTTRRLTLRFSSTGGRDLYDVATPFGGALVRRRDLMSFTAIGFRYALRHARGGIDVGYASRQSNVHIDEESGIRVALVLSFSP